MAAKLLLKQINYVYKQNERKIEALEEFKANPQPFEISLKTLGTLKNEQFDASFKEHLRNEWAMMGLKIWFTVVNNDFTEWPDTGHSDYFLDNAIDYLS
jgi:hypothetical protein